MIKQQIEFLIDGNDLSFEQSLEVMNAVMSGEVNNSQIAALLTALKAKGETSPEIAGFAAGMRNKSLRLPGSHPDAIDMCGTGGDSSGTFNISTAASIVAAGAGVKVAKHGNRSMTSKSGSADVLKALGVNISLTPEQAAATLEDAGICFLFAPGYHPAMKYAVPVRKELGFKTVFNILGPLTNPAGTRKQLIGTFNTEAAELMANALPNLEMERVLLVCTDNRYDEVTLTGTTEVIEYQAGKELSKRTIDHETFGYPKLKLEDLRGGEPDENAVILKDILEKKKKTPAYYVTAANAAMGLYAGGFAESLEQCTTAAEEAIDSGKALNVLEHLIQYTEQFA